MVINRARGGSTPAYDVGRLAGKVGCQQPSAGITISQRAMSGVTHHFSNRFRTAHMSPTSTS